MPLSEGQPKDDKKRLEIESFGTFYGFKIKAFGVAEKSESACYC
jgi:hypothetical protein